METTSAGSIDGAGSAPLRAPTTTRIQALDLLRGVALLGILLMNILGFGLHSAGYFNPHFGTHPAHWTHGLNMGLWALMDITVEGAMRALFSMLFGASVVLFATGARAKSRGLHYRRQFWLLRFGLVNGFVLLWVGDVLVTYALCGMLLYPLRHWQPRRLVTVAAVLILLQAGIGSLSLYGLNEARQTLEQYQQEPVTSVDELADESSQPMADDWQDFAAGVAPTPAEVAHELAVRRGAYGAHFVWNAQQLIETLVFVLPFFLLWDGLIMMLLGMAFMQWGLLSAIRSRRFYWRLCLIGLAVGLCINGAELLYRVRSGFDPLVLFNYFYPTYHLGRLAMALAWLGAVMLFSQAVLGSGLWQSLRQRLAAVGQTALSNYLLQSLVGLLIFSGVGLGWVGLLERWQLYLVVIGIWALQLWVSPWWLARYQFGPLEWVWRQLTYGRRFPLRR